MAKKNEKVNLKTNYYIMMPKAHMIVEEGKCFIEVTQEQFDRIKASYESGILGEWMRKRAFTMFMRFTRVISRLRRNSVS